ncbi:MAG TPA: PGPGW domain-containing protein [Jatrophihabitantaceae bacterium]|nr:PGPGW domain-containing protein [Jatrophihabitantaceae bacterium]
MTQREAPSARKLGRFGAFRDRVRSTRSGRLAWRIVVTVAGVVVIAGGIVLLAIPGPGWLVIFAGLGLLATEYSWARRLLWWARARVTQWTRWVSTLGLPLQVLLGLLGLAVLAALAWGAWWIYTR